MLVRHEEDKEILLLCWLPIDKRIKEGSIITLKGDEANIRWKVEKQFTGLKTNIPPETKWGLDLPKSQRTER